MQYLNCVLKNKFSPHQIGLRNSRELSTLAMTLDALLGGNIGRAADILTQRFRALETAVAHGGWSLATHMELVPSDEISLTSPVEQEMLMKREMLHHKLQEARRKASGRHAA